MPSNAKPRVIIVGGGLAGLAAAIRCARLGLAPIVLEKRGYLGGRAFSFKDRETGVVIDNGQHVFLGAFTEYIQFLDDIGSKNLVHQQVRCEIPILYKGVTSSIGWSQIKALGMVPSLLKYRHLRFSEKLRVIYGMFRIWLVKRIRESDALQKQTFKRWLEQHGQTETVIQNLWNLLTLPSLNDDIKYVSAYAGIMLFQTAMLSGPTNPTIGYSKVGLSTLTGSPASAYIQSKGGEVHLNCEVRNLEFEANRITSVQLADGSSVKADQFIVATPHGTLANLIPKELFEQPIFERTTKLQTSPIVGIHIWYDKPVLKQDFIAILNSPIQFVFNLTRIHPNDELEPSDQQHIVISLSGAHKWVKLNRHKLKQFFLDEMERTFPEARTAKVIRFLSVKQPHATFRVTPGSEAYRPSQRTSVKNLFLAGDWTCTGWPSTMEGAVRSGNLAADAIANTPNCKSTT